MPPDLGRQGTGEEGQPLTEEPQPTRAVRVKHDSERRFITVEGDPDLIEDFEEQLRKLGEEEKKISAPPDIRIYRLRYIDVFTATEIIDEMFNATQQQRQQAAAQARLAAQQQARQQRAQQRQQQQQGQGKPGQPGQPPGRGQQEQQQQQQVPTLPPTSVRVYPSSRDRTLILRADSSQFPALLELIATIDQPQPIESTFRTFRLERLNAAETVEVLEDLLGLDETSGSQQRRTQRSQQRGRTGTARSTGATGGQLPQTIMQDIVGGTGALGVDAKDIKITSNEEANTILVMAPAAALDYVGALIQKLDGYELPERIWKSYELAFAKAEEVAEYLASYFAEETPQTGSSRSGRKGRSGGGATTGTPKLDAPTVIPYTRLNLLSVQATAEDMAEIDGIIERLDVETGIGVDFRVYVLQYADAKKIHEQMKTLLVDYMRQLGRDAADKVQPFSIEVDEKANALMVLGDAVVFAFLQENLAKVDIPANARALPSSLAVTLKNTNAQEAAQAINRLWAVKDARAGETPPQAEAARGTNTLIIRGTQDQIDEIKTQFIDPLEEPTLARQTFVHPLEVADATSVAQTLQDAYRGHGGGGGGRGGEQGVLIAADVSTNSLVITATQEEMQEIEALIEPLDSDATLLGEEVRVVTLLHSDANEVKESVTEYLRRPGASGGGRGGRGGTSELAGDVRISVLEQTNAVIVSGESERVAHIETLIRQMDEAGEKGSVPQIIPLEYADAGYLLPSLEEMFEESRSGTRRNQPAPTIVVNDMLNALIVRGAPTDVAAIEAIVAKLDTPKAARQRNYRVIEVPPGINVTTLAELIEEAVNEGAEAQAPSGRRGSEVPSIRAIPDSRTSTITVSGSPRLFDQAEQLASEYIGKRPGKGMGMAIIPLTGVPADDVVRLIEQLKGETSSSRGRSTRGSGRSSRGSGSRGRR